MENMDCIAILSAQSKVIVDVVEAWNSREKSIGGVYILFRYQVDLLSANKRRLCTCQLWLKLWHI